MANVVLAPVHSKLLKTWTVLAHSASAISHTGTTTETALVTYNLAAGSMGPNGVLRVWTLWTVPNNANTKTMRVRLGASGIGGSQLFLNASTTIAMLSGLATIRNRNSQSSQIANGSTGIGTSSLANLTATIDTSAAQNIVITGQLGVGTDTLILEAYEIELLYGA